MPHTARKRSKSGFYHVVPKGINSRTIFEDDSDRALYLQLMTKAKKKTGIRIHAYCLMSNHVHLVLEDQNNNLSEFIKYIHERYGTACLRKYERLGGVFAKKCWSEPIETDRYLLCAVRYVHANPAHAGICKASVYEWSSAKDYLGRKGITDTSRILDICGGVQEFIRFSQAKNSTFLPFPGSKLTNHESDDEAMRIANVITGMSLLELPSYSHDVRAKIVRLLVQRGFSVARIVRLSGLSRGQIRSCL